MAIFAEKYYMPIQFSDLGINEQLQHSLVNLQISVPTEIQEKTIPIVLNQKEDLPKDHDSYFLLT